MTIKLIVGLGNPGSDYEKTRHNAGVWLIEELGRQYQAAFKSEKHFHGSLSSIQVNGCSCHLLIPSTFMNHSGRSVQAVAHFYHYKPEEILVAHDELDLPVGSSKLKLGGGHGGHNGLRDIIQHLGTQQFWRIRLGISHPGHRDHVLDYVLGTPSRADKAAILAAIDNALLVLPKVVAGETQAAMNMLHTN